MNPPPQLTGAARRQRQPQAADAQVAELQFDVRYRAVRKPGERGFQFEDGGVVFLRRRADDPRGRRFAVDGVRQGLIFVFERGEAS